MTVDQIAIAVLGTASVWLANDARESWRKWACIVGLANEPFWFYAAWVADQWGVMFLCAVYSVAWFRGFRSQWMKGEL